jgi:hypothetical protein
MERNILYFENVRKWVHDRKKNVPLVEVIELLVPCVLHFENHVGEKIITVILRRFLGGWVWVKMVFFCKMESTFQKSFRLRVEPIKLEIEIFTDVRLST